MRAILYPSEISGRVDAPPSKSMAHRALICAALAKGESHVLNLSASQDITATLAAMRLPGCVRGGYGRAGVQARRRGGLCPLER
ncbi:MAG: hypothetical protein ACLVEX_04895 [Ruthenibacterium lactatiformans]